MIAFVHRFVFSRPRARISRHRLSSSRLTSSAARLLKYVYKWRDEAMAPWHSDDDEDEWESGGHVVTKKKSLAAMKTTR